MRCYNKKGFYIYGIAIFLFITLISTFLLVHYLKIEWNIIGLSIFEGKESLSQGTFMQTNYNNEGYVELSPGKTYGEYSSIIFDAVNISEWNNISWNYSLICTSCEQNNKTKQNKKVTLELNITARSCDDQNCEGEQWEDTYETSPSNITLANNRYFQYKATFYSDTPSESPKLYNLIVDYIPLIINSTLYTNNTITNQTNITQDNSTGQITNNQTNTTNQTTPTVNITEQNSTNSTTENNTLTQTSDTHASSPGSGGSGGSGSKENTRQTLQISNTTITTEANTGSASKEQAKENQSESSLKEPEQTSEEIQEPKDVETSEKENKSLRRQKLMPILAMIITITCIVFLIKKIKNH